MDALRHSISWSLYYRLTGTHDIFDVKSPFVRFLILDMARQETLVDHTIVPESGSGEQRRTNQASDDDPYSNRRIGSVCKYKLNINIL